MDEISRTSFPEPSGAEAGNLIGRVVIAVILAEGIWGLIVSVTNNLILPLLARTMGGDVQSPLYLGKGDFNVPALFTSILELCFAGIAAVVLNAWVQRKPRVTRGKVARISPIPTQTAVPPSPAAVVRVQSPAPSTSAQPTSPPSSGQFWSPPEPPPRPKAAAAPPPAAKPAKPKPPKEVYYNIVGEPINPTEDD